jgi:lysophospholipase L1-like esterase
MTLINSRLVKLEIFLLLFLILFVESITCYSQSLFLIAGQSNAVGTGDNRTSPKCSPNSAFEYKLSSDEFFPLIDPVGESKHGFDTATSGSAWPAFANRYNELSSKPVYIVPAAKGGSTLNPSFDNYLRWDSLGHLWMAAIEKCKKASLKINLPINGVIWAQGEADAGFINARKLTRYQYKQQLKKLIIRFRRELGEQLPFYIIQTGYAAGEEPDGYKAVQEIQDEICKELPFTYIVYPFTKYFHELNLMKDYIHYNQKAYNLIGKTVAEVIFSIDVLKKYEPLIYGTIIYPNPLNSTVTISITNITLGNQLHANIFNSMGTNVRHLNVPLKQEATEKIAVDLIDLPDGLYYIHLYLDGYSYVQKLIKSDVTTFHK